MTINNSAPLHSKKKQEPNISAPLIHMIEPLRLKNGEAISVDAIPVFLMDDFSTWLVMACKEKSRLIGLFPLYQKDASPRLIAILADDFTGRILLLATTISNSYPSLTNKLPEAHLFERILYEEYAIIPEGHPWLKPVRFSQENGSEVGVMQFYKVTGEDVHEVAVGPIHAGVIECGHFRFQCLGELVMHLEISLGYHHRGILQYFLGRQSPRAMAIAETIAGDTTIAHAWAYCGLLESLAGQEPTLRGSYIRALALELERLANHTGDIGAIAGDTGFLPTMSYCGRLRGDWLNTTALLCGNRFGRGLVRPGGAAFDLDKNLIATIKKQINDIYSDVLGAIAVLWNSESFIARVEGIGAVSVEDATAIGMVGIGARSCGMARDVRLTHPLPHLPSLPPLSLGTLGDVYARTKQRENEIKTSVAYCQQLLLLLEEATGTASSMPLEPAAMANLPLSPHYISAMVVEGWRGEVCHVAITDEEGAIATYQIVDPSFHNWMGLALALRNQQISDFPLCNKSFNLSYCGHDL